MGRGATMLRSERMVARLREQSSSVEYTFRGPPRQEPCPPRPHATVRIDGASFKVLPCPMDGRCFYHAVARASNALFSRGQEETANSVFARARVCDPNVRSTWAEDSDVSITARALSLSIHIWEGLNGMWIRHGEDDHPRIFLRNPSNVHYEALVPVSSSGVRQAI